MSWNYLNSSTPLAFAHRGGAHEFPQNTMAAFRNAVDLGYTYLELDVRATADGVLAVYHDPTLDTLTDRTGAISELSWNEVQRAKVAGQESVPRLEDVLRAWPHARLNIDPKTHAAVQPLVELLRAEDCYDRVCVSSFSDRRIRRIRKLTEGRCCTGATIAEVAKLRLQSLRKSKSASRNTTPPKQPPSAFTQGCAQVPAKIQGRTLVDAKFVNAAHSRGIQIHVWTINDPAEMRYLLNLGVDGIMTDAPKQLKEVMSDMGLWDDRADSADHPAE